MNVSRIEWTFHVSSAGGSGTDSHTRVEILRDGHLLANIFIEPGETDRLDRGDVETHAWTFQNPGDIGVAVSGTAVPYTEDFPAGVAGHLKTTFRIYGDDAWRVGLIESAVITGELRHVPDTIDAFEWVETPHRFQFRGEDVLSTNAAEGGVTLTLNY
jgi:hypothetical protein